MANYLVTGAAGFIASQVVRQLLDAGHQVVGLDNLNDAYDVRIKDYRLRNLQVLPGFVFHKVDISDFYELCSCLEPDGMRFDAIFNLAARAGVRQSVENPWAYVNTNMTGTLNMLELARRLAIPKFILASTSSIYGANAPLPTPETFDSDHPLQPYAATKKGAEALCHSYHYLNGLDITILRYFTVYGPAGRPDMVMFRFCQWISEGKPLFLNGDGEQSRGFTYVDDIARGTILALKPVGFEIINLGGHDTITINQLIRHFEKRLGRQAQVVNRPFHPADMLANQADVTRAKNILGWQPEVGLDEGITNLFNWYQAERAWASQLETSE